MILPQQGMRRRPQLLHIDLQYLKMVCFPLMDRLRVQLQLLLMLPRRSRVTETLVFLALQTSRGVLQTLNGLVFRMKLLSSMIPYEATVFFDSVGSLLRNPTFFFDFDSMGSLLRKKKKNPLLCLF